MPTTTVETSVIAELVRTVGSLHKELGDIKTQIASLEIKVDAQNSHRRELAKDLKCLSDGVKEFQEKFEPYLKDAVKQEEQNQDLAQKVKASVVGWGTVSVLGASVLGIGYFVLNWLKSHGPSP